MADQVFTEPMAKVFCALAIREGRCAELLNALESGGAVTLQPTLGGGATLVILNGAEWQRAYRQMIGEDDDADDLPSS